MTRLGDGGIFERIRDTVRSLLGTQDAPAVAARRTRVIGHRGAPRVECENTIGSFARAVEEGADGIELDVCVTRDGQIVVWHDANPDTAIGLVRQAGREELAFVPDVPALGSSSRKAISDLDLADVRENYGYHRRGPFLRDLLDGDTEPSVPFVMFREALGWARGEPRLRLLCVDVKLLADQTSAAELVYRSAREFAAQSHVDVALLSPQREIVEAFQHLAKREPLPHGSHIYADFEVSGILRTARELGVRHVSMGCGERTWSDFREELVDVIAARERGDIDSVIAWTIDDEDHLRDLSALRPDGIITNVPAVLRKMPGV